MGSVKSSSSDLSIISWNVNGLRACAAKGFGQWLAACNADIVGVQEVRAQQSQLPEEIASPTGWHPHFVAAQRPGYSGVGLYSRQKWQEMHTGLGQAEFDAEGRSHLARFGKLSVFNGYFPNGNGKERDNSRIPFKLDFYRSVFQRVQAEAACGQHVVVMGDFNTAPREIDLARPKDNVKVSGFCPEERQEIERWLSAGWIDSFRHVHPERTGAYSWWSQRFGVREKNVGWRIDLMMLSPSLLPYVRGAEIHAHTMGSDHCPVHLTLDRAVLSQT